MYKIFGKYQLVEQLSRDSTGSVYSAHLVASPRQRVIVRLFDTLIFRNSALKQEFVHEIAALKQIRHAYLLPVVDCGCENDIPYIVTAYAPNGSLYNRLRQLRGRFGWQRALKLIFQIGQALVYIHERGLVHGDIKPENILFDIDDEVQLADVALAPLYHKAALPEKPQKRSFYYMAPEQFRGSVSPASDQYALACLAYELLTGHPPFSAQAESTIKARHINEKPAPLSSIRSEVPVHVNDALLKALAKDPSDRHESVYAFISALNMPLALPSDPGLAGKSEAAPDLVEELEENMHQIEPSRQWATVDAGGSGAGTSSRRRVPIVSVAVALLVIAVTAYVLHIVQTAAPPATNPLVSSTDTPLASQTKGTTIPDAEPTEAITITPLLESSPTTRPQVEPTSSTEEILLAEDSFDGTVGPLLGQATGGQGWESGWLVQQNSVDNPGYIIQTDHPLLYSNLKTTPSYLNGGKLKYHAGRSLRIDSDGPFADYLQKGMIDKAGTTLWVSVLLRKDNADNNGLTISLHHGDVAWCGWGCDANEPQITFGYLGNSSNKENIRYWTLSVPGDTRLSTRTVDVSQPVLLVLRIDFGSATMVSMYIDPPSLGRDAPVVPDVSVSTTTDVAIAQVAFYAGDDAAQGSIDELRFGTSYAAVTPTR